MEQLAQMGVDESAYVWHSGLPDWVRITNVPELKEMLENNNGPAQDEPVPNLPEQEAGSDELGPPLRKCPNALQPTWCGRLS